MVVAVVVVVVRSIAASARVSSWFSFAFFSLCKARDASGRGRVVILLSRVLEGWRREMRGVRGKLVVGKNIGMSFVGRFYVNEGGGAKGKQGARWYDIQIVSNPQPGTRTRSKVLEMYKKSGGKQMRKINKTCIAEDMHPLDEMRHFACGGRPTISVVVGGTDSFPYLTVPPPFFCLSPPLPLPPFFTFSSFSCSIEKGRGVANVWV